MYTCSTAWWYLSYAHWCARLYWNCFAYICIYAHNKRRMMPRKRFDPWLTTRTTTRLYGRRQVRPSTGNLCSRRANLFNIMQIIMNLFHEIWSEYTRATPFVSQRIQHIYSETSHIRRASVKHRLCAAIDIIHRRSFPGKFTAPLCTSIAVSRVVCARVSNMWMRTAISNGNGLGWWAPGMCFYTLAGICKSSRWVSTRRKFDGARRTLCVCLLPWIGFKHDVCSLNVCSYVARTHSTTKLWRQTEHTHSHLKTFGLSITHARIHIKHLFHHFGYDVMSSRPPSHHETRVRCWRSEWKAKRQGWSMQNRIYFVCMPHSWSTFERTHWIAAHPEAKQPKIQIGSLCIKHCIHYFNKFEYVQPPQKPQKPQKHIYFYRIFISK